MCKSGDTFSLAVLIDRGLDLTSHLNHRNGKRRDAPSKPRVRFTGNFVALYSVFRVLQHLEVGADGGEGTPVPIPNTAVKLTCADNTWAAAPREDKKAPTRTRHSISRLGVFLCI